MTYEQVKNLKPEDFKRLCGVRPETFGQMLEVVRSLKQHKRKPGRPVKLGLEDQLLMTLEYWREYRTYFHIGQSWGVNESTAYRTIRKIEDMATSRYGSTMLAPGTDNAIQDKKGGENALKTALKAGFDQNCSDADRLLWRMIQRFGAEKSDSAIVTEVLGFTGVRLVRSRISAKAAKLLFRELVKVLE